MRIAYIYRKFETETAAALAAASLQMWKVAVKATGVESIVLTLEQAFTTPPQAEVYYFRSIGSHGAKAQSIIHRGAAEVVVDPYLRERTRAHTKEEMVNIFRAVGISCTNDEILTAVELKERWDEIRANRMVVRASKGGRRGTRTWRLWPSNKKKYEYDSWLEQEAAQIVGFDPTETKFLLSDYIPNDGDWRLITVGQQCAGAYKRPRKRRQFRLTASKGKSKWALPPQEVVDVAVLAAQQLGYMIASHDIVVDQTTGQPVVVETNSAPSFGVFFKRTGINPFETLIREVTNV